MPSKSITGLEVLLERKNLKSFPIIDTHTHFFPPRILKPIWQYFEKHYWPVYRKGTNEELAKYLISKCGVTNYFVLNYAHKRGIAPRMNDWTIQNFESILGDGVEFKTLGTILQGNPVCEFKVSF